MNYLNYDEMFLNIMQMYGNELSKFERYALIVHMIFMKNKFKYKEDKLIDEEWNKEFDKAYFEYSTVTENNEITIQIHMKKDPEDADSIVINLQANCPNKNKNLDINSNINLKDPKVQKINFNNLDETIVEKSNLFTFIRK